jgi:hypothetical protein
MGPRLSGCRRPDRTSCPASGASHSGSARPHDAAWGRGRPRSTSRARIPCAPPPRLQTDGRRPIRARPMGSTEVALLATPSSSRPCYAVRRRDRGATPPAPEIAWSGPPLYARRSGGRPSFPRRPSSLPQEALSDRAQRFLLIRSLRSTGPDRSELDTTRKQLQESALALRRVGDQVGSHLIVSHELRTLTASKATKPIDNGRRSHRQFDRGGVRPASPSERRADWPRNPARRLKADDRASRLLRGGPTAAGADPVHHDDLLDLPRKADRPRRGCSNLIVNAAKFTPRHHGRRATATAEKMTRWRTTAGNSGRRARLTSPDPDEGWSASAGRGSPAT